MQSDREAGRLLGEYNQFAMIREGVLYLEPTLNQDTRALLMARVLWRLANGEEPVAGLGDIVLYGGPKTEESAAIKGVDGFLYLSEIGGLPGR